MFGTSIVAKYKDWFLHWNLSRRLRGHASVLDLGCGESSPLACVKKRFLSIGVDGFHPSIAKSKKQHNHDRYICCNLLTIDKRLRKKSVDAVVLLDVIEHFHKKDGLRLLKKAEAIARKSVIVLTPNGFYAQDELGGNPYQIHKSGWSVRDLKDMGYRVNGLRGLKYIRGDYATIYRKPWIFWAVLAFISEPILYFFPSLSYQIWAIKYVNHE